MPSFIKQQDFFLKLYEVIKRLFDIIFSLLFLFLSVPLIFVFAILIRLRSKGTIFYCQNRLGLEGRTFKMWKIRTMHSDSEKILAKYLKENTEAENEWRHYFCLKNDPRIVGVLGKYARKYSIDELPQFFNVLKGDMSLVGPRPVPFNEYSLFSAELREVRNSIKPGITGLWQVSGRSEMTIHEKLNLDIKYIKEKSLLIDLKIIAKTPWAVISSKGAI